MCVQCVKDISDFRVHETGKSALCTITDKGTTVNEMNARVIIFKKKVYHMMHKSYRMHSIHYIVE